MIEELDILRNKIDLIDKKIIDLLSKRFELVSEIGDIKNRHGLLIYAPDREKMMLTSRRQEALNLGVSPDLIEDILRRIIQESYLNENEKGFKKLCLELRQIVIIDDNKQISTLLSKMFLISGYQVKLLSIEHLYSAKEILMHAGMVIISTSVNYAIQIIEDLPPLSQDCILVYVSTINHKLLKLMLKVHHGPVLGLHLFCDLDMKSMVKQVVIYCHGRRPEAYQWLLDQIRIWGANLYCYTSMTHYYKYISCMQSFLYFMYFINGLYLVNKNIKLDNIILYSPAILKLELVCTGKFFSQSTQLYEDIIYNLRNNLLFIKCYYQKFGKIISLLEENNKHELYNIFTIVNSWFGQYVDSFLMESNIMLRQVNNHLK